MSGKFAGQSALVKCSGNGWVQLETPLGEVAKRATELELIEIGKQSATLNKPTGGLSISIPASLSSANVRRRSNSESLVMSPTARSPQFDQSPRHSGMIKESRTVLVDPKIRSLQTDYFRKYVEKEVAKVKKRPDLKYWNSQIHSAMIDENHEREVARDIRDNYCHFCNVEKWPGSIVCWNELCTASPIYWKLPGAAGSPSVPEARYRRMESVFSQRSDKRRHSFDDDHEPSKRLKSQRTLVMTEEALEDERIACEILGSLSSLSPGECFPNIVTEYMNTSPVVQIPSPASPPSPTASNTSSSSAPSPFKHHTQKNERSDSGATDSEDIIRSENSSQPLILKYKNTTSAKESHPPLVSVPETKPLQVPSDSLRPSMNQMQKTVVTPSASVSSPNTKLMNIKKPRSPFAPNKGMFLAQGTPPSHEEFARFVTEHHLTSQKSNSSFPSQQENKTPPLSALTARVDAQRGSEAKSKDLFHGQDVANGPPLLGPTHNSMESMFPPH